MFSLVSASCYFIWFIFWNTHTVLLLIYDVTNTFYMKAFMFLWEANIAFQVKVSLVFYKNYYGETVVTLPLLALKLL